MEQQEQLTDLKCALEREKSARKIAEELLEQKSSELFRISEQLQQSNAQNRELSGERRPVQIANATELNSVLNEQQDKLEILLNNSHVGIALASYKGDGAILVNATACNVLGYTEDELKSATIGTIVHPDDIPRMQKNLNALYDGEKDKFSVKARLLTKEEKIIWTRFSVAAVRDATGKVKYEVVTFEDITDEKELRDRLNQSESLLATIFVDMPIGLLIEDEQGKIILTNEKFCSIFNLESSPKQLIGSDSHIIAEQNKWRVRNPDQYIKRRNEILEKKSTLLFEEIEFADGRVFELEYMPLSYNDNYIGCLWGYKDITYKKNLESKLKIQKEKYTTIIANMNLGWTEADPEGNILAANKSFCDLSGYSLEELKGKNGAELLLADSSKEKREYYNNKEQSVYKSHGVDILTKSGEIKHLLVSGLRTHDSNGDLDGSIGVQFDITEQRKLELQKEKLLKKLKSQNEQLNDYAHVVSHDLKSPLRSISALLTWTKEDFSENLGEAGLENINLIEKRVEKMDVLIEDILSYSRLDNAQLNKVNIDLNLVLKDILEMIFIPEHIQVHAVKLPMIFADAARIQQLFQNLIGNAVNHVDKLKGKIEIDFIDTDTHYQFVIKDNGKGIKKEYYDKIFKVFKSFDDREMSTGIGLSIVKKIIDQHGGKIWLESEVGVGTTFFFTLKKQA